MSTQTLPIRALTPRWVWPAFAIPAVVFFVALAQDYETLRVAAKPIPVLVLAAAAWVTRPRIRYRSAVAIALLFGSGGDLLLELGHFELGLAAFLIGQLFYIAAFLDDDNKLKPLLAAPFLVWGVALTWALADGTGDLLIPVAFYALALCSMMWRSLARIGSVPSLAAATTAIGAVLFGISDSLIAIDKFGTEIAGARWWIMATYWAAQILITYGALRREA